MKLTERERKFCAAVDLAPIESVKAIARRAELRPSAVRYLMHKLVSEGVLYQRVRVDFFRLGILDTGLFFSLGDVTRREREKFERTVISDQRVAWFGSLAGQYQYGLTVFTKSLAEFGVFLNELGAAAGSSMAKRILSPRLIFSQYNRAYLGTKERRSVELASASEAFEIDELDRKILSLTGRGHFESIRALARSLGAPYATIERRFAALQDKGIIRGIFYEVEPRKFGVAGYRLHLGLRALTPELAKAIARYCHAEAIVTFLTQAIGSWDYEIGIEVSEMSEVVRVTAELSELCSGALSSLDVLGEVRDIKWSFYPL